MPQEGKIAITINKDTWKQLQLIRLDQMFKTLDDVVKYLLKRNKHIDRPVSKRKED